ncbi:MAG: rod shape-determining protein RodA [Candidatus Lernaella stagnicola]|nr:rod shape-determining protein RodA [Candidatus Lernaella stagnicola]
MLKRRASIFRNPDSRYTGRIDRRLVANFDWPLLTILLLILLVGLVNLYSATHHDEVHQGRFTLQFVWILVGLVLMVLAFAVNYQVYKNLAIGILVAVVIFLLATLVIGYVSHGARRWLILGPLRFQPSEFAKLAVTLALAKFLSENQSGAGLSIKELRWPAAIVLGPTLLVLLQPDLGTAIMTLLIAGTMILFVGVRKKTLIGLGVSGAFLAPVMYFFLLKDYQRERILTLLDPARDPTGTGWHIRQSLIAIGSGRTFGKGFLMGTQTKLDFLPEQHTDFIFSVMAEEWGFIGGFVILALFFALVMWGLNIAMQSKDEFGTLLAVGLTAFVFWHVVVNIGMVLGLLPVVGVPLPFVSYGRTSLLTMMIAVGLLLNISSRRYIF